jgi:hypothetical protein
VRLADPLDVQGGWISHGLASAIDARTFADMLFGIGANQVKP